MRLKIAAVIAAALGLLALLAALLGLIPLTGRVDHPPCDRLPTAQAVEEAIAGHPEMVGRIEGVGPGVQVGVGRPCGEADQAVMEVRYETKADQEGVEAVLQSGGFGVPVVLVRA